MSIVESKIIRITPEEQRLRDDYDAIDARIEIKMRAVDDWKAGEDGRRMQNLSKRRDKMVSQLTNGEEMTSHVTQEELDDLQRLTAVYDNLVNAREAEKKCKKDIKSKLDSFTAGRKIDPNSVHNLLEAHGKNHNLCKGKAFGGSFNGSDGRKVMKNPNPVFDGYRAILKANRRDTFTEEMVDKLCDDTILCLKNWDAYFRLMNAEKPSEEEAASAKSLADKAVEQHVKLLGNKTPKVHVAEDHAVKQFQRLPVSIPTFGNVTMCVKL